MGWANRADQTEMPRSVSFEKFPKHPRGSLRGFERIAVPIGNFVNGNLAAKWMSQLFLRTVGAGWVGFFARRRWILHGMEHVEQLNPERGVILVSNHRSFFDMYVTSALLFRRSRFMGRLFFPVRSNFFYTSPVGVFVNLVMAGCSMWPPVFRDDRKYSLNPVGLQQMAFALAQKGAVLGYHPEGTRGKGPDPYEFLPARRGIGQLISLCHPDTTILPLFIVGMGNDLKKECGLSLRPPADGSAPIRIHFGAPVRAGELDRNRTQQEIADHLLEIIGELAQGDIDAYGKWLPGD